MKTIQLGPSNLFVTTIYLDTMTFGEQVDEPTAHDILDRALERGVNIVDTANVLGRDPKRNDDLRCT